MKASCSGLIRSGGKFRWLISSVKVSIMFFAAARKSKEAVRKGVGKTEEGVAKAADKTSDAADKVAEKSSDASITSGVKASFYDETLLQGTAIDVQTRDQIV